MAEGESRPVSPAFATNESSKSGYVMVKLKIDGLKVKGSGPGLISKLMGKHPLPEGKNAEIERPIFHTRSVEVNVRPTKPGAMNGCHYRFKVRKLPYDIEPDDSYLTAEDGWVSVYLKKSDPYNSWETEIRTGSLETAKMDDYGDSVDAPPPYSPPPYLS